MVSVFFRQKPANEMRISDWSSDVCSSDLTKLTSMSSGKISRATIMDGQAPVAAVISPSAHAIHRAATRPGRMSLDKCVDGIQYIGCGESGTARRPWDEEKGVSHDSTSQSATRSEEHTSELQSLMRIS